MKFYSIILKTNKFVVWKENYLIKTLETLESLQKGTKK